MIFRQSSQQIILGNESFSGQHRWSILWSRYISPKVHYRLRPCGAQRSCCEVPWEDATFSSPAAVASQLQPDIFSLILRCDLGSAQGRRILKRHYWIIMYLVQPKMYLIYPHSISDMPPVEHKQISLIGY